MAAPEGEMIAAWKQEGGARRMHTCIRYNNGDEGTFVPLFSRRLRRRQFS